MDGFAQGRVENYNAATLQRQSQALGGSVAAGAGAEMQPYSVGIHDEIDRIQSALSEIEARLHGGTVAQLPNVQGPSTGKVERAPCLRGAMEAAVDRLRTIRMRIEAVSHANSAL